MNVPSIKLKVERAELVKALKAKQAECLTEHQAALKRYEKDNAEFPKRLIAGLREAAKHFASNGSVSKDRYQLRNKVDKFIPEPPTKPVKPEGDVDLLSMLEMGEGSIVLSEEQYRRYMRGCRT